MNIKGKAGFTATKLRVLLSLSLLLIVGAAVAGFSYARTTLKEYAVDVSHKKVDAEASSGNISALQTIKSELAKNQDVVAKAKELKSDSEFPEFRIVNDVTRYARQNGLTIENFDFGGAAAATASGAPTTSSSSSKPKSGASSGSSEKSVSISVVLKAPVNYARLLQFMYDINQNLPKMQIKGINISASEASSSSVSLQPIVIEMYTR